MTEKLPISVVVPVRDEARNIGRCLNALGDDFAEVLVVDSGSADSTVETATARGARVIQFQWNGRFPKKRNWVLRNVEICSDWVLFIDADEQVTDALKQELRAILPRTQYVGFWLTYLNTFFGKRLRFGDRFRKLALFRKNAGEYEKIEDEAWSSLDMEVHEHPVLEGAVGRIHAPVIHEDYRGFEAYISRHNAYSTWEARRWAALRLARGQEAETWSRLTSRQRVKYRLMDTWFLGPAYFTASYFFKLGFLDGKAGLVFAVMKMIYFFQIKCKIEELKREGRN